MTEVLGSVDKWALDGIAASLEADGYHLAVTEARGRWRAEVTAGPDACADCLVPKAVFRGILAHTLRVPAADVDVSYPDDHHAEPALG